MAAGHERKVQGREQNSKKNLKANTNSQSLVA